MVLAAEAKDEPTLLVATTLARTLAPVMSNQGEPLSVETGIVQDIADMIDAFPPLQFVRSATY